MLFDQFHHWPSGCLMHVIVEGEIIRLPGGNRERSCEEGPLEGCWIPDEKEDLPQLLSGPGDPYCSRPGAVESEGCKECGWVPWCVAQRALV